MKVRTEKAARIAAALIAALAVGAVLVNDVSGGLADPNMAKVVAGGGCPWILMHWRGHSREMAKLATYHDVVAEVRAELRSLTKPVADIVSQHLVAAASRCICWRPEVGAVVYPYFFY